MKTDQFQNKLFNFHTFLPQLVILAKPLSCCQLFFPFKQASSEERVEDLLILIDIL